MRKVLIYEFVTGGGWWSVSDSERPPGSLFREGTAMVAALARDFARMEGCEVECLLDGRVRDEMDAAFRNAMDRVDRRSSAAAIPKFHIIRSAEEEHAVLVRAAQDTDWAVVIAPEFDGHLLRRVQWLEEANVRLLSPNSSFVVVTADKHATARRLAEQGVPTPCGTLWRQGESLPAWFTFPAVIKPRDGAGSQSVRYLETPDDLRQIVEHDRPWRIEHYCPGEAASISILCGTAEPRCLPASRQIFEHPRSFAYAGGETPLAEELCARAARLAHRTCRALPPTVGYVGIDMVLGNCPDGSRDVVIEVNPRLTTSYIGLRRIVGENLAEAMMRAACGTPVELTYTRQPIRFSLDDASG